MRYVPKIITSMIQMTKLRLMLNFFSRTTSEGKLKNKVYGSSRASLDSLGTYAYIQNKWFSVHIYVIFRIIHLELEEAW